jgi:hypothetical protein
MPSSFHTRRGLPQITEREYALKKRKSKPDVIKNDDTKREGFVKELEVTETY